MKRVLLIAALLIGVAGCGGDDNAPPTATETPTATATVTSTDTPSDTRTPTPTRTITLTPSVTPTLGPGANIGFIGILRADNTLVDPVPDPAGLGRIVFERPTGSGFVIVVEAQRGTNNRFPGELSYNLEGPPDLQIEADRDLGNGSTTVCDNMEPDFGGVHAIAPDFSDTQAVTDALNDFGCRFTNGAGEPIGRHPPNEGCVLFPDGEYGFVNSATDVQFCGTVTRPMLFKTGETLLIARVLDASGLAGPERQIVIRVLAP